MIRRFLDVLVIAAMLCGCAHAPPPPQPAVEPAARATLYGGVGENAQHFHARLIVRACAFQDSDEAISRTVDALNACSNEEDQSACEFTICLNLRKATNPACKPKESA